MRTDPEYLRHYLLGEPFVGIGLLERVRKRVRELSADEGPQFNTSSIMKPTRGMKREHDLTDDGTMPKLVALVVGLVSWHRSSPITPTDLTQWLHKNGFTDVDYLLGRLSEKDPGLITHVKDKVRFVLGGDIPDATQLKALAEYLAEWLGDACVHEFLPVDSDAKGFTVFRCAKGCGSQFRTDDNDSEQNWRAV